MAPENREFMSDDPNIIYRTDSNASITYHQGIKCSKHNSSHDKFRECDRRKIWGSPDGNQVPSRSQNKSVGRGEETNERLELERNERKRDKNNTKSRKKFNLETKSPFLLSRLPFRRRSVISNKNFPEAGFKPQSAYTTT